MIFKPVDSRRFRAIQVEEPLSSCECGTTLETEQAKGKDVGIFHILAVIEAIWMDEITRREGLHREEDREQSVRDVYL